MRAAEIEANGKMFLTQNYLVFSSKDQATREAYPFYRITSVNQEKSGLFSTGISVEMDNEKVGAFLDLPLTLSRQTDPVH